MLGNKSLPTVRGLAPAHKLRFFNEGFLGIEVLTEVKSIKPRFESKILNNEFSEIFRHNMRNI